MSQADREIALVRGDAVDDLPLNCGGAGEVKALVSRSARTMFGQESIQFAEVSKNFRKPEAEMGYGKTLCPFEDQMRQIISLPVQTVGLSCIFGAIAYYLARYSTVTLEATMIWLVAVGGSFHILFWANKRNTSAEQLRALEYVYIVVGLLGVLGVLEVQSTVLQSRVKEIISHYYTEDYNDMYCDQIKKLQPELPSRELENGCHAETEMIAAYGAYDHERLKKFIDSGLHSKFESVRIRAAWMQGMYKEMQDKVYSHFWDPKSNWWLILRLLGFYMVFVGVAIKFAKTSAEICGWDKVTQEKRALEQADRC